MAFICFHFSTYWEESYIGTTDFYDFPYIGKNHINWNHGFFYDFPYIGNFIIPTDELIFFRGVGIPPTRYDVYLYVYLLYYVYIYIHRILAFRNGCGASGGRSKLQTRLTTSGPGELALQSPAELLNGFLVFFVPGAKTKHFL